MAVWCWESSYSGYGWIGISNVADLGGGSMKTLFERITELYHAINKQKPKSDEEIYLRILTDEERDAMMKFWELDKETRPKC